MKKIPKGRSTTVVLVVLWILLKEGITESNRVMGDLSHLYCRDSWITNISYTYFAPYTCAKCFHQVFFGEKPLTFDWSNPLLLHDKDNLSITYEPDAEQADSQVCALFLSKDECSKWKACCSSAKECCLNNNDEEARSNQCPATWDGVACWNAAQQNQLVSQPCPSYYEHAELAWLSPVATKQCEENGTWYVHPEYGLEISNYKQCIDISVNEKIIKISLIVGMVCKSLSILFISGALLLTVCLKYIRQDLRQNIDTKVHFNLYVSLFFMSASWLVMDGVHLIKLMEPDKIENQVWCRLVHGIAKYFLCASYMCLFCEGLHLYRRFTNIMDLAQVDGIVKYYVISWGLPAAFVLAYITARILVDNSSCWIDYELSYLELIYFIPNTLTYLFNLYFLIRILISVCRSLRTDTRDRFSNCIRQSIRALFYLIPIFGLQFLFILYRPMWPPYEIIAAVCIGLQGVFATVLYFYTNRDVKTELKILFSCKSKTALDSDISLRNDVGQITRDRNCSLTSTVMTSTTQTTVRRDSSAKLSKLGFSTIVRKLSKRDINHDFNVTHKDTDVCQLQLFNRLKYPTHYKDVTSDRNGTTNNREETRIKHGSWNGMPLLYSDRSPEGNPNIKINYKRSNSCGEGKDEDKEHCSFLYSTDQAEAIGYDLSDYVEFNENKNYLTEPLTPILERRSSAGSRQ